MQYGLPVTVMYAASQGLGQAEFDSLNFLENDVLDLRNKLVPPKNSSTMASSESDGEAGRPEEDIGEITDSGEKAREGSDDW